MVFTSATPSCYYYRPHEVTMSSGASTQARDQAKVSPSSFLPPPSAPGNEVTTTIVPCRYRQLMGAMMRVAESTSSSRLLLERLYSLTPSDIESSFMLHYNH